MLIRKGYAKLLAIPGLFAVGGKRASFLSGGEIPIVYQDQQRFHIDYKEYGVRLKIKPIADDNGNINLELTAEVSSIDLDNGVKVVVTGIFSSSLVMLATQILTQCS